MRDLPPSAGCRRKGSATIRGIRRNDNQSLGWPMVEPIVGGGRERRRRAKRPTTSHGAGAYGMMASTPFASRKHQHTTDNQLKINLRPRSCPEPPPAAAGSTSSGHQGRAPDGAWQTRPCGRTVRRSTAFHIAARSTLGTLWRLSRNTSKAAPSPQRGSAAPSSPPAPRPQVAAAPGDAPAGLENSGEPAGTSADVR